MSEKKQNQKTNRNQSLYAVFAAVIVIIAVMAILIATNVIDLRSNGAKPSQPSNMGTENEMPPILNTPTSAEQASAPAQTDAQTETVDPETIPVYTFPSASEQTHIESPIANLYFSEEWADRLKTEEISEGSGVAEVFYSELNAERVDLFKVSFGDRNDSSIGTMQDPNGNSVYVSYEFCDLERKPEWTDEEYDDLIAMQEELNTVLANLEKEDSFQTLND